jgi:hypothetical protein
MSEELLRASLGGAAARTASPRPISERFFLFVGQSALFIVVAIAAGRLFEWWQHNQAAARRQKPLHAPPAAVAGPSTAAPGASTDAKAAAPAFDEVGAAGSGTHSSGCVRKQQQHLYACGPPPGLIALQPATPATCLPGLCAQTVKVCAVHDMGCLQSRSWTIRCGERPAVMAFAHRVPTRRRFKPSSPEPKCVNTATASQSLGHSL